MKKIFISSILAASLLYAENEGAKQEEIIDAPCPQCLLALKEILKRN